MASFKKETKLDHTFLGTGTLRFPGISFGGLRMEGAEEKNVLFFRPNYKLYIDAACYLAHWQVCDAISVDEYDPVVLYYISNSTIWSYNLATCEVKKEFSSTVSLYSIKVKHGYLAACGYAGLFVKDLREDKVLCSPENRTVYMGEMNNAVDINIHGNEVRLFVAHNNGITSVFSLPSMDLMACINLVYATNYASCSPDNNNFLLLGDFNSVQLRSIDEHDKLPLQEVKEKLTARERKEFGHQHYKLIKQIDMVADLNEQEKKGNDDESLDNVNSIAPHYADWSNDSRIFVITHDAGFVSWYDFTKNSSLMGYYRCHQQSLPYKVQFSRTSNIFAFSERQRLHIINADNAEEHQVVEFPTELTIEGLSFAPDDSKLFVGTRGGIAEFSAVGVQPLSSLCIRFIRSHLKDYDTWTSRTWDILPEELLCKIFTPSLEVFKHK